MTIDIFMLFTDVIISKSAGIATKQAKNDRQRLIHCNAELRKVKPPQRFAAAGFCTEGLYLSFSGQLVQEILVLFFQFVPVQPGD